MNEKKKIYIYIYICIYNYWNKLFDELGINKFIFYI